MLLPKLPTARIPSASGAHAARRPIDSALHQTDVLSSARPQRPDGHAHHNDANLPDDNDFDANQSNKSLSSSQLHTRVHISLWIKVNTV